ncbi:hypothetical protein [Acaryochloris marina]|uniref:hypothetical protein n=1 Tax=Acaryochloris marina TaxID=155978 RepID=UPI0021C277F9|nr:hypothetical protein [Acaryochloris marina]
MRQNCDSLFFIVAGGYWTCLRQYIPAEGRSVIDVEPGYPGRSSQVDALAMPTIRSLLSMAAR